VDEGDEQHDARALRPHEAPEAEDDGALVLAQDADRGTGGGDRQHEDDDHRDEDRGHGSTSHSSARRTERTSPCTWSTTTGSPTTRSSSRHGLACQRAPSTKTFPSGA